VSADDAFAIANLKARYCLAADTSCSDEAGARALFDGVFAADFVGDYGYGTINGASAIIDFMCGAIAKGSEWMIHALGSPRIAVAGDSAEAHWTITVHSRRRNGEGMMTVLGRYADRLVRTPDGWRIAGITFTRYE
jgi:hypothetical protein